MSRANGSIPKGMRWLWSQDSGAGGPSLSLIPLDFLFLFISIFKSFFKEKLLFQMYSVSLKISLYIECLIQIFSRQIHLPKEAGDWKSEVWG